MNPAVLRVLGMRHPPHAMRSKFSAYHIVAVGFTFGAAGPQQFSEGVVHDPRIVALRDRIELVPDAAVPADAAIMRLTLASGATHEHRVLHVTGSAASPMTDEQILAKADLVARPILGTGTDGFLDAAWNVERLAGMQPLTERACSPAGTSAAVPEETRWS